MRREDVADTFLTRLLSNPLPFLKMVCLPLLVLAVYGFLYAFAFFTPLSPWPHRAALALLAVWILFALRGAVSFWPRWGHVRFALPVFLLVGFGSCWGTFGESPARAWVVPPAYAQMASVALGAPERAKRIDVVAGSAVHVTQSGDEKPVLARFYGEEKELELDGQGESAVSFVVPEVRSRREVKLVLRRGWHRLAVWRLRLLPDNAPRVSFTQEPEVTVRKTIRLAFDASDDYGVQTVAVRVAPVEPSPGAVSEPVEVVLATPGVTSARSAGYADLTALPWAGMAVTLQLIAVDGAGHKSFSAPKTMVLPTRQFRNPFARALIEERQKLLGQPDPATRDEAANVMAGIARQQALYRGDPVVMMSLRSGAVRLVLNADSDAVHAIQNLLWQTALRLEEGVIGLARLDIVVAERDLSSALLRHSDKESIAPYLARMEQALTAYFEALEAERARQPPGLQHMDWPLAMTSEMLTPEDLQNKLAAVRSLVEASSPQEARAKLDQLQGLIENLRTTPPELTPDQFKLVQQTSALRSLVRGQRGLLDDSEDLQGSEARSPEGRKKVSDGRARLLSQQQLLLSALREVAGKIEPPSTLEVRAAEKAMTLAITALQQKNIGAAQQLQAEALALMENSLLAITERMRQSLTARAP